MNLLVGVQFPKPEFHHRKPLSKQTHDAEENWVNKCSRVRGLQATRRALVNGLRELDGMLAQNYHPPTRYYPRL